MAPVGLAVSPATAHPARWRDRRSLSWCRPTSRRRRSWRRWKPPDGSASRRPTSSTPRFLIPSHAPFASQPPVPSPARRPAKPRSPWPGLGDGRGAAVCPSFLDERNGCRGSSPRRTPILLGSLTVEVEEPWIFGLDQHRPGRDGCRRTEPDQWRDRSRAALCGYDCARRAGAVSGVPAMNCHWRHRRRRLTGTDGLVALFARG